MKGFIGSFAVGVGLAYGGLSLFGKDKIMKIYMSKSVNFEVSPMAEEWKKAIPQHRQHSHAWNEYLTQSLIHHNQADSSTSYLYFPKGDSQGFPGVCHGGFSYSLCLTVAHEHAKNFNIAWPPKNSKMTYKAPIKTENHYQIKVTHQAAKENPNSKQIKAEIVDSTGKVYSTFTSST